VQKLNTAYVILGRKAGWRTTETAGSGVSLGYTTAKALLSSTTCFSFCSTNCNCTGCLDKTKLWELTGGTQLINRSAFCYSGQIQLDPKDPWYIHSKLLRFDFSGIINWLPLITNWSSSFFFCLEAAVQNAWENGARWLPVVRVEYYHEYWFEKPILDPICCIPV